MATNDATNDASSITPGTADGRRPIRWWPAALILAAAAVVLGFVWVVQDVQRQNKHLQTLAVTLTTFALLLLWMLLLSRARWKYRLLTIATAFGVWGILAATLEITGVTGDLIPIVEWRWRTADAFPDPDMETQVPSVSEVTNGHGLTPEIERLASFPQFGGPNRNGTLEHPSLSRDWNAHPPKQLWRRKLGGGWSGFATWGQSAVTMEQRGKQEYVTCYHLLTGEPIWSHRYDAFYESTIAGDGPRSVPTIHAAHVFAIGSTGVLNCLELATGRCVWSKNILTEHNRSVPEWGFSASPLVVDRRVIINPGGRDQASLVAYDAANGQQLWGGGDDGAHYSSPVLATFDGVRQVLLFNQRRIVGHRFDDGSVLWDHEWIGPEHPNVSSPVVLSDNRILASAGYGEGSELFRVVLDTENNQWSTSRIWHSRRLKSKFSNIIVIDEFIYGLDDGIFVCVELSTGDLMWKKGRYGHGQMILVHDVLLIMTEKGEIVLLDPNPEENRELARFTAFATKTWNPPALAGEYLLVRNDKEAACYRLSTEAE